MKKILIITVSLAILGGILYFYIYRTGLNRGHPVLSAGGTPEDFTLGMKGSRVYMLNDINGRYIIVLAFLDNGAPSEKFLALYRNSFSDYIMSRPDVIWFNITKENSHIRLEEQTKHLGLIYRMPGSDLPDYYSFKNAPMVLVIDKKGVLKLVYSGYSPTIISDLRAGLSAATK